MGRELTGGIEAMAVLYFSAATVEVMEKAKGETGQAPDGGPGPKI
jgi:hypothetical protein